MFGSKLRESERYFTDGSKFKDGEFLGFASVHMKSQETHLFRTTGIASIFTAEALAIAETLNIMAQQRRTNSTIFTDSESVLQALHNLPKWTCCYLILLIKEKLKELRNNGVQIEFYWIPAHRGIYFNEVAYGVETPNS